MIRAITENLQVRKGPKRAPHNAPLRNCGQLPQYEKGRGAQTGSSAVYQYEIVDNCTRAKSGFGAGRTRSQIGLILLQAPHIRS
jgi:hypothetical protein